MSTTATPKGDLYLIPCPIDEGNMDTIATDVKRHICLLDCFVVERLRTARRFIAKVEGHAPIDDLMFFEFDKHDPEKGLTDFLQKTLMQGKNVGLISEAGYPGIADPGQRVTAFAHRQGIKIHIGTGPSSILMALVASGFNGQSFTFHGYLSNKKNQLRNELRRMESEMLKSGYTQLFMEAPYRNQFILQACLEAFQEKTMLSVACELTASDQYIRTASVREWKKEDLSQFHKRPAILAIGKQA